MLFSLVSELQIYEVINGWSNQFRDDKKKKNHIVLDIADQAVHWNNSIIR